MTSWTLFDVHDICSRSPEFLWPNRIQNMLPNAAQAIESNGKGDFFYLTEFRGKFTCPMSLDAFPTDVQECAVKIITRLPAEQIVLSALRGIRCLKPVPQHTYVSI